MFKWLGGPRKTYQDRPSTYEIRFWPVLLLNPVHFFTGSVRPVLSILVLTGSVPRFRSGSGSITYIYMYVHTYINRYIYIHTCK